MNRSKNTPDTTAGAASTENPATQADKADGQPLEPSGTDGGGVAQKQGGPARDDAAPRSDR